MDKHRQYFIVEVEVDTLHLVLVDEQVDTIMEQTKRLMTKNYAYTDSIINARTKVISTCLLDGDFMEAGVQRGEWAIAGPVYEWLYMRFATTEMKQRRKEYELRKLAELIRNS